MCFLKSGVFFFLQNQRHFECHACCLVPRGWFHDKSAFQVPAYNKDIKWNLELGCGADGGDGGARVNWSVSMIFHASVSCVLQHS